MGALRIAGDKPCHHGLSLTESAGELTNMLGPDQRRGVLLKSFSMGWKREIEKSFSGNSMRSLNMELIYLQIIKDIVL